MKRFIWWGGLFVFIFGITFPAAVRAQTMTISGPAPGSSFLAPATMSFTGQVDIAEGEWFEVRVFRLPPPHYNARNEPVRIAQLQTNRFELALTNLPATSYEYEFILSTLNASVAASNRVAFSVTNFAFRLGPYAVTDLGTLGGTQTMAFAINNRGQAVGKARDTNDVDRAVLFENGTIRDLGTLGGEWSSAHGINDLGDIVGGAEKVGGLKVPFVYRTNQMEDLGFTESATALGINDRGDIIGELTGGGFAILDGVRTNLNFAVLAINNLRQVVGGFNEPTIRDLEIVTPFVDDPVENSYIVAKTYGGGGAFAINDARQFTGMIEDGSHREYNASIAMYSQSELRSMPGLAAYEVGLGINRWGEVVGSYLPRWDGMILGRPDPNPPLPSQMRDKEAIIANGAGTKNLNSLIAADSGWVLLEATDINDVGQIVGFGKKEGEVRAFRLDPVLMMGGVQKVGDRVLGTIHAVPGAVVKVEASGGLKNWQALSTNTSNGYVISFDEPTDDTASFFRASWETE